MNFKNIRHIFFDADDTLWENHLLFLDLIMLVIQLIKPYTEQTAFELEQEFYSIQEKYLNKYGYGLINFIPPLITLLGRYYPLPPFPGKLREAIDEFRHQMLFKSPPLIPGIKELIEELIRNDYALHLLTKGNFKEQMKKLQRADILYLFDEIRIVEEKTPAIYRRIAVEMKMDPGQLLMVGNSLKSDVYPALHAGWHAVRYKREFNWHFEEPEKAFHKNYIEINDLKELPSLLDMN